MKVKKYTEMMNYLSTSPYQKQVGGKHYIKYKIQPSEFVVENKLLYPEGSVIKYILRHQDKGGKQDLEKAIHFIEMIIERDYRDEKEKKESWVEGYKKWKNERCPHN
jgi:hypothetical protein